MADEASLVRFERFVLDLDRRELERAGERIPLRPKTLALLIYLVENRSRVVSKQELLRAVWPGLWIEVQGIYQSVAELRAVFGGRHFIRTVRGTGYQWVGEAGTAQASRNWFRRPGDFLRVLVGPAVAVCTALTMLAATLMPDASRLPALAAADPDPEALVEQARTYFAEGKLDTAERALSSAVASNPQHLGARLGLAQVRFAQGEQDRALQLARGVYREAMGIGAPNIRMESALLLSELTNGPQDIASARAFAHEVIELATRLHSPLVAAAGHERLGDIYLAQGDRTLAEFQFDEAARGYSGNCPSGEQRVSAKLKRIAGRI